MYMKGKMMQITESEWKIMELLWKEPMTITQLSKALYDETRWKKNTVIAFLNRMVEKGSVYYEEGRKARIYYPKASKEEVAVSEARGLLERFFNGNRSLMISALSSHEKLSESELDELCRLLNIERMKR